MGEPCRPAQAGILRRLAAQGAMIERLASDSRRCAPGVAFLAYPGEAADGRAHIGDAIRRGASAVLWEQAGFAWRERMARAERAASRDSSSTPASWRRSSTASPSESLWMCGVTGTNGKTSCSQWIAAALNRKQAALRRHRHARLRYPRRASSRLPNTTPDALEVQAPAEEVRSTQSARGVAMEVSSHGLAQGRVNGVAFDCALFTNLSHDHLDYHGTMEAYAAAKEKLFDTPGLGAAVLNLDDAMGARLAQRLAGRGLRVIGYGFADAARGRGGRIPAGEACCRASTRGQVGRFNLANALGVLGCLLAFGCERQAHGAARRPAAGARAHAAYRATGRWSSWTTRTRRTRSRKCCKLCVPWRSSAAAGSPWCSARAATATRASGR